MVGKAVQGPRLPWNRAKSWAGTAGFLVGGMAGTWLCMLVSGMEEATWEAPALYAIFASAIAESLPLGEFDNLAVPLVAWLVLSFTL